MKNAMELGSIERLIKGDRVHADDLEFEVLRSCSIRYGDSVESLYARPQDFRQVNKA